MKLPLFTEVQSLDDIQLEIYETCERVDEVEDSRNMGIISEYPYTRQ